MSPFIEGGWAKQIGSSKGQSLAGKVLSSVGLVDVAPSVRGAETAAGGACFVQVGARNSSHQKQEGVSHCVFAPVFRVSESYK